MKVFRADRRASTERAYSVSSRATMAAASSFLFIPAFRGMAALARQGLGLRGVRPGPATGPPQWTPFTGPGMVRPDLGRACMNRTFTYFIVGAMVLGVAVG